MPDEPVALKFGAAYVRVSTDDQLEYSPESQVKLIQEHARREGYVIPPEYIFQDGGISGRSADRRPAFRLMIATAKEEPPPFEVIYVWKFSRFARNQEEAIMYKNLLKKRGVDVRSISEPSSDSPFASLIERIIEWMDEYYLLNLSTEVRRGMREKATRGEAMGRAPFGYRVENKRYVPDENADIVRYIFQQYAAGVGYRALAEELQNKGVKSANGKKPTTNSVEYILHNPAYIGKIRWCPDRCLKHRHPVSMQEDTEDVVYVDGKHEALIDLDTWNKVQAKLEERHVETKYRRRNGHMFMLKGIIRCGTCGATLIPQVHQGRLRLQCCNYGRGCCRVSHSIDLDSMNAIVLTTLEDIAEKNSFVFTPSSAPAPAITREWGKLIAAEETKLERVKAAYLAGAFTVEEFKSTKEGIEATIKKLNTEKNKRHEPRLVDLAAYRDKLLAVLEVLKTEDIDEESKNEALRSIIDKILFQKPQNTIDVFFAF